MAREKAEDPIDEGDPGAWMATFSDLVTLLITFFVLILSMSSLDAKALDDTFGFFNGRLGALGVAIEPMSATNNLDAPQAPIMPTIQTQEGTQTTNRFNFDSPDSELPSENIVETEEIALSPAVKQAINSTSKKAFQQVGQLLKDGKGADTRERFEAVARILKKPRFATLFEVQVTEDTLKIRFAGDLMFLDGRVRIRPESLVLLREMSRVIASIGLETRVVGVVPPGKVVPVRPELYPTGWELATARGCNVVRYLQRIGKVPPALLSCGVQPPSETTSADEVASGVVFELRTPER